MLGIGTDTDLFCEPWTSMYASKGDGMKNVAITYALGAISYSMAYQLLTVCFGMSGLEADELLKDAVSKPPVEEPPTQNPPIDPPVEDPPTQNPPQYPPLPEPPVPEPEPPTSGFPPADDRTSCEYWTPRGFQAAFASFAYEHQHPGHGDLTESEFRTIADSCFGESQLDIDDYVAEVKGLPILMPEDDDDEEIDTERILQGQPERWVLMVVGTIVAYLIARYVVNTVKGAK